MTRRDLSHVTRWHWHCQFKTFRSRDRSSKWNRATWPIDKPILYTTISMFHARVANPTAFCANEKTVYTFFMKLFMKFSHGVQESGGITLYLPVPDKPHVGAETNVLGSDRTDTLAGTGLRFSHVEAEGAQETQVVGIRPEGRVRDR